MSIERSRRGAWMVVLLLAPLFMVGCAMADRVSGVSQAKALQKTGEPAEATILEIWDTGWTVNGDPVVGFTLEVRPLGRPAYQAETKLVISRVHVATYQPGAVVPVLIDPKDSRNVALDIYDFAGKKKGYRL